MSERYVVVHAADLPYGTTPARRCGDKSLWVVFDTLRGGPPSSSQLSTTDRSEAERGAVALNLFAESQVESMAFRLFGIALGKTGHFNPDHGGSTTRPEGT